MSLQEMRKGIDAIDFEVLKLLNERMELAVRARRFKTGTKDPEREKQLLENYKKNAGRLIAGEFAEKICMEIVSESKRLQEQELRLGGFQGEHGAYSEIAVRKHDASAVPIPCLEFSNVFDGVKNNSLDFGIVPVENSLEGAVNAVNDLLVAEDALYVTGEIRVPIHHCLLTLPETDYRDIKVVYSHPQALGQCRGFLARNKLEPRPYYDTAGAALMLSKEKPNATAVIASKLCAETYGLEVLKENLEDHQSNSTRFLVLSKEKSEDGNKCSIAFSTKHKTGALFNVLKIFAEAGVNLTRIESRPLREEPAKFAFLLDFQSSHADAQEVLKSVSNETEWLRLLGCYKEATQ